MSDDSTTECLLFPGIFRKPIVAQFDQREGSSDGGALLLKAAEGRYGLLDELTACLRDQRQAGKVDHGLRELLAQRVMPGATLPNCCSTAAARFASPSLSGRRAGEAGGS